MTNHQSNQPLESAKVAKVTEVQTTPASVAKLQAESTVALSSPPDAAYRATFNATDKTPVKAADVTLHDSSVAAKPAIKHGTLDGAKSPAALAAEGKIKDRVVKDFQPPKDDSKVTSVKEHQPKADLQQKSEKGADKVSELTEVDKKGKTISVHLENRSDPSAKTAHFTVKADGQIEMLKDPEKNNSKNIEIEVERKAGQINPTKEQIEAANELVRYLSQRNQEQTGTDEPPVVLQDKDNIITANTEKKSTLAPPEEQKNMTAQTREQVGNLNRFNGSGGADMPMEASRDMGSFDTRQVSRQLNESDKQAALKEVVAGLFSPDSKAPYETIRKTPDGVTHVGRYGLSAEQIGDFFEALGDPIDPSKIEEMIKAGKLPKDFADKLKDPKFLTSLKNTLKAIENGTVTAADLTKVLPKELQELIATDLVEKVKSQIGDKPGAIGTAILSGKGADNLGSIDFASPTAVETMQAGDKLYQIATTKIENKANAATSGSDQKVGDVPEGERKELIAKALQLAGQPVTDSNLAAINTIIVKESGWNPNALNDWDSNAKAGTPSKGLMQTIPTTFSENALAGYDKNIFDPLSNIIAGIRYSVKRYGSLDNVPGLKKMAAGQGYVGY